LTTPSLMTPSQLTMITVTVGIGSRVGTPHQAGVVTVIVNNSR